MNQPLRETVPLESLYFTELRNGGMRKALKSVWTQGKIPGKITLQDAKAHSDGLVWHRCSVGIIKRGKALEMQTGAAFDKMNEAQQSLVREIAEYIATGPFTTLIHNLKGLHLYWLNGEVHLILQLFKSTTHTHTNLKTLEKWLGFKHPEVKSAFTLVYTSNQLFRFTNEKLAGKLPFRSLFGKETVRVPFEQGPLVMHLQGDHCDSLHVQNASNQKFLEWIRPNSKDALIFWQSRSPLWIQLALNNESKVQVFSSHYATLANLRILGRKTQSHLKIQDKETSINQFLEWVKTHPAQVMVIEDINKIMSKKWFEALEGTECRKILRVYEDFNTLSEESRVFHKYNWSLLKSTALQTHANEKHFKIMVLYTTGRIKDIGSRQAPAPSKSGPKFVQR